MPGTALGEHAITSECPVIRPESMPSADHFLQADFSVPIPQTSSTGPALDFLHARQTGEGMRSAGRKNLGCLASLLDRPQKLQQVGVDFILVCGCEAVRPARIVNFLRPFDEPGRFLR